MNAIRTAYFERLTSHKNSADAIQTVPYHFKRLPSSYKLCGRVSDGPYLFEQFESKPRQLARDEVDDPRGHERQLQVDVRDRPEVALRGGNLLEDVPPHDLHPRDAFLFAGDGRPVFGQRGGTGGQL